MANIRPSSPAISNAARLMGENLRVARLRRRESQEQFGNRIGVSRQTLAEMEQGSLTVGMGLYATALWALGMVDQLAELGDPDRDVQGRVAEREQLPERVRQRGDSDRHNF